MEDILDVYKRPYNPLYPMVCLDELCKQLIGEIRKPIPVEPGQPLRYDHEYKRNGVANLFMAFEPLAGKRYVEATEHRTKVDFAKFICNLVEEKYPESQKIILVMDNLNTHTPASLYELFEPAEAKRIADRMEIHYTPKHGSWLNMAEIELGVLSGQCLSRRIESITEIKNEVASWESDRNKRESKVNWRFTTPNARIKLKRLYPSIE